MKGRLERTPAQWGGGPCAQETPRSTGLPQQTLGIQGALPRRGDLQVHAAMAASECTPRPSSQRPRGPLTVFPTPWLWGGRPGGCRPCWLSGPAPWQGWQEHWNPSPGLGLANKVVSIWLIRHTVPTFSSQTSGASPDTLYSSPESRNFSSPQKVPTKLMPAYCPPCSLASC